MNLVRIIDLVGKDVAGVAVDIRSRRADGSLKYEHQTDPLMTTLKSVQIKKKRDGLWLYWSWERIPNVHFCGCSGVRIDETMYSAEGYYLLVDYDLPGAEASTPGTTHAERR